MNGKKNYFEKQTLAMVSDPKGTLMVYIKEGSTMGLGCQCTNTHLISDSSKQDGYTCE